MWRHYSSMAPLFHQIPSFRPFLSYLLGLTLAVCSGPIEWSGLLVVAWLTVVYALLRPRMPSSWSIRWMPGMALCLCWVCLGCWMGKQSWHQTDWPTAFQQKDTLDAVGRLKAQPVAKKRTWQVAVRIEEVGDQAWRSRDVVLYLPKTAEAGQLVCGDRIRFRTCPQPPPTRNDTSTFDYGRWLRRKGYTATGFVRRGDWSYVAPAAKWDIMALAERAQQRLLHVYASAGITGEAYALVASLTLGARETLEPALNQSFAAAGVSHILSVSGLHVAVVFVLLKACLFFLGYSQTTRRWRDALAVVCLWGYAFVTGLAPSVCRAALMCTLLAVGQCLNRRSSTLNTVLFSAWLLLLAKPSLLYDLGFQLSYSAVIGLVVVYPVLIACWTPRSPLLKRLWELMGVSLVAQLVTAPLTIHYFGQFPTYFLLANLIAVPLSSLLIYLGGFSLLLVQVPLLSEVTVWSLKCLSAVFIAFIKGIEALPLALYGGLSLPAIQLPVVYVWLVALLGWLLWRRRWLPVCLGSLLVWQACVLVEAFMVQIDGISTVG